MSAPGVLVFIDYSNIFIPSKEIAQKRERGFAQQNVRIHFENLLRLAVAGRRSLGGYFVGSALPPIKGVWERARAAGLKVELFERGRGSNTEQAVDQALQVSMLRAALDFPVPQVAVLLTGDGRGYEDGVGYHADLQRLHRHGWGVEVISWENACRQRLKHWAQQEGVFVSLDRHYESITFIEGGRPPRPVSLVHRAKALPRLLTPTPLGRTGGA